MSGPFFRGYDAWKLATPPEYEWRDYEDCDADSCDGTCPRCVNDPDEAYNRKRDERAEDAANR